MFWQVTKSDSPHYGKYLAYVSMSDGWVEARLFHNGRPPESIDVYNDEHFVFEDADKTSTLVLIVDERLGPLEKVPGVPECRHGGRPITHHRVR